MGALNGEIQGAPEEFNTVEKVQSKLGPLRTSEFVNPTLCVMVERVRCADAMAMGCNGGD